MSAGRLARLVRYLGVGGACAGLHNLVMIVGDRMGVVYPVLILVSYVLVVIAGYGLHALVTFRESLGIGAFARYAAGMAGGVPMTFLLLFVLHQALGLPMIYASPIGTAVMLGVNFLISRWAIARPVLEANLGGPI